MAWLQCWEHLRIRLPDPFVLSSLVRITPTLNPATRTHLWDVSTIVYPRSLHAEIACIVCRSSIGSMLFVGSSIRRRGGLLSSMMATSTIRLWPALHATTFDVGNNNFKTCLNKCYIHFIIAKLVRVTAMLNEWKTWHLFKHFHSQTTNSVNVPAIG